MDTEERREQAQSTTTKVDRAALWKHRAVSFASGVCNTARRSWSQCTRWSRLALTRTLELWRSPRTKRGLERARAALHQAREASSRGWSLVLDGWHFIGFRILRVTIFATATSLLTIGIGRLALQRIAPGELGVRVSEWGGEGVAREDFGPGLHLDIPGLHAWHRLPSGTQWVAWRATSRQSPGSMLGVRTQDGNEVLVAVSVPYRIRNGEAHMIVAESNRNTYHSMVSSKTETLLLAELGRLSSEQFIDGDARAEVLASALVKLNESLADVHIVAEQILVEDVRFPAPYEKKLQETQLEKLRGEMLEASRAVSQEERLLSRRKLASQRELQGRRLELDRAIQAVQLAAQAELGALERETASYVAQLRARADREYEQLALAGQAKLLEAEGLEEKLENQVYASDGGKLYLARLAAQATHIEAVTLNASDPDLPNLLDPEEMTRLFIGE